MNGSSLNYNFDNIFLIIYNLKLNYFLLSIYNEQDLNNKIINISGSIRYFNIFIFYIHIVYYKYLNFLISLLYIL